METLGILQNCLGDLKSLVRQGNFQATGGIRGTEEPRTFKFGIGKPGHDPAFQLCFQDYPGGWIESNPQKKESVLAFIKESDAVVITIDAPGLMEPYQPYEQDKWKSRWHEKINKPLTITTLLKNAYRGLEQPKLVIFALVRCEKYIMEGNSAALLNRVQQGYKTLLVFLGAEALRQNVAVVVTPVQTVGSVIFSRVEVRDGQPFFWFRQTANPQYNPIDSEQPLRYILRFVLKKYTERKGFWAWLGRLFRKDTPFKQAVAEMAKGCKNGDGFAVLQGQNLLNIR
ncbi:MAG: hypothetical protein GDA56_12250 [Hormoscilla sp. GM7CHS1pb]|nr:hypothetical protein [Hormoscilla sp. GM7CHS1pb]